MKVKTRKGLFFDGEASSPAERQEGMRQLKKGQILSLLRTDGPLSRAEISRALGFNLRSVSVLVDSLVEENLVIENEGRRIPAGRPPIPVQLNPRAACVLGVDIGRARTRLALMDLQGKMLHHAGCETTRAKDPDAQSDWLAHTVSDFLSQNHTPIPPLAGAGVATEGLVHLQNTPDRYTPRSEPARKRLETLLRVPVVEDSDCNFTALAEHWFGKAKGSQHAVVFNLTDGLGVGCFVEGRLLAGSRGWAGQVGHFPLGETGIPCFCGARSCLENVASGSGIIRMAKEAGLAGRNLTATHVAEMARDGSRPARKIFERFGKGLAKGIAVTIDFLNPESVILAGPVARHADLFMDTVREEVRKIAVPFMMEVTRIEASELCEDGVILGTCIGILNQVYDSHHVTMRSML